MEQNLEKSLLQQYKKALDEIRGILGFFYAKFSNGDELTMQEMNRYNRLRDMENQLIAVLEKLSGIKETKIYETMSEVYAESFYRTAYALEQGVGITLSYTLLNERAIRKAILLPIDKLTLTQRLKHHRKQITETIRKELTQGLIQGESYSKMANRIKGVLDGDAAKAIRVVRTEAARAQNEGYYESYQHASDQGVDMVLRWLATLDRRTRVSHQMMDGKKVKFGEDFDVNGHKAKKPHDPRLPAAQVVNCRCTTTTEIEGISPTLQRRARDYENPQYLMRLTKRIDALMAEGYTEKQATKKAEEEIHPPNKVLEYTTYEDWKKSLKSASTSSSSGTNPKDRFVKVKEGKGQGNTIPKQ